MVKNRKANLTSYSSYVIIKIDYPYTGLYRDKFVTSIESVECFFILKYRLCTNKINK